MRKALAQVAASTVHPDQQHVDSAPTHEPNAVAETASSPDAAPQRSGRSRGSRGGAAKANATEAAVIDIPVFDIPVLDIPDEPASRPSRRVSSKDAEHILDAVLDALPEPKQPGQGRSRVSRRATSSGSGIITSGPTE